MFYGILRVQFKWESTLQNPVKLHLNYTFKQFLNKQEHNIPILFSLQYTAACLS